MTIADTRFSPRSQLADLQSTALGPLGGLSGVLGCAWLLWALYPDITGAARPAVSIAASAALATGGWASLALSRWSPRAGAAVLIGGMIASGAAAMAAYQSSEIGFLLAVPAVIAGALMARQAVLPVALLSCAACAWACLVALQRPALSGAFLIPVCGIAVIAFAAWLSARNLHVALEWTWYHFEQAVENERIASRRQGELRQALKALDEATYRIERANHMLGQAREQAEDARRLKQQFAQTISHELRTPLNLITGFTELMAGAPDYYGGPLSPAYQRDLNVVYRNARHLQTLVNDVLDLARIEAAQMSLTFERTQPSELVDDVLATVRSMVELRRLDLRRDVAPDVPALRLDPIRVRQVLLNLLSNAVRFTEQGAITVSARQAGPSVVFAVADTGIGMPPEQLAVIFEEFRQVDGGLQRAHEGTGLGLAISRRFVELHGGRIWAESRAGAGSTFYFSLPIDGPDSALASGAQPERGAARSPDGNRLLLTVSRSPSASAMLARHIRDCRLLAVADLDQARRVAESDLPQCVIVDVNDSPMDAPGVQALAQAWAMPQVAFMACPLPGEPSLRRQLDVTAYLTKPVSQQSLWDVLRQFGSQVNRVLVIDDDRDFVRLVSRMLDNPLRRYQVIGAHSGQEGLDMLRFHQPDLVLLDMVLPDMRGERVIEHMRADAALRRIPIVVVSAQDEAEAPRLSPGAVTIARQDGLSAGELVRLARSLMGGAAEVGAAEVGAEPVSAGRLPPAPQEAPAR